MNSIIFSKMTRKQVIDAYSNKEYKKMIQMLRGIFVNRKGFLKFLNDDSNGIDNIYLRKFREILYIWTVIDEFKQLLNNTTDIITISYMQEFEKDYVKDYFNEDEIKLIKERANRYFIKQKNRLLLKNYEDGNFKYVIDAFKCDYKDYYDYESTIAIDKGYVYERAEIAPLRELSRIFKHANLNILKSNNERYKYAMLNNLIDMYKYMNDEYIERYLVRQKKIGINIEKCFFNKIILKEFSAEDKTILSEIYDKFVRNGLKVNGGLGLYDRKEYTRRLHTIMNIIELSGTDMEKFKIMKYNYGYIPYTINECISGTYVKNAFKKEQFESVVRLVNDYSKFYDGVKNDKRNDEKTKLGLELGRIITEFLDNDVDIDSYFNQNELLKREYTRIQKYVNKYCPDVYDRFIAYRESRIMNAALMIRKAIINNELNNEIDYYSITNIPYRYIRNYLQRTDSKAFILFDRFIKNNSKSINLTEKGLINVLNSVQTFIVAMPDGSFKTVEATLDDKKLVVSYLNDIGVPITAKNISIGLRRYLNNKECIKNSNLQKRITL